MIRLNLPEFEYKVKKTSGKVSIFDIIRKKYVILTPEEWVRQSMVHFLVESLKYPRSLISIETGLKYNLLAKRSDILVYDRDASPFLLIECKTFQFPINQKAMDQLATYNKTISAPYIALTNGLKHYCIEVKKGQNAPLDNFPAFPD